MGEGSPEKWLDEAVALLATGGDPDAAARLLQQVVERDRGAFTAWHWLGVACSRMGEHERAIRAFESGLKVGESADLWREYGRALLRSGQGEEGRRALRRAASLGAPPRVLFEVACSFEAEGRVREALTTLLDYLRQEGDDPEGWEHMDALAERVDEGEEVAAFRETHCSRAMRDWLWSRRALAQGAQGFPVLGDPGLPAPNLKPLFHHHMGRVLLGSAGDDGVHVPLLQDARLGVDHLGVTIARLLGTLEALGVRPDTVLALDPASEVLAGLIAEWTEARALGAEQALTGDEGFLLAVSRCADDYLAWRRAVDLLPADARTFALTVTWLDQGLTFEARHVPDVTGVLGRRLHLPEGAEMRAEAFQGFLRGAVTKHRAAERERQRAYHAARREVLSLRPRPRP